MSIPRMVLLLAMFVANGAAWGSSYWVSFSTYEAVFVMKINDSGEILIPPTRVNQSVHALSTALVPAGSRLGVWVAPDFEYQGRPPRIPIQCILVNKDTLSSSAPRKFVVLANWTGLSASQREDNIFVAFDTWTNYSSAERWKGFGLAAGLQWDGRSFRISPGTEGCLSHGGVSADGRMASTQPCYAHKLILQPLLEDGTPVGDPVVVAPCHTAYADVSNPLPGGRRLVAYITYNKPSIYVQPVDALTGQRVPGRRLIASFVDSHHPGLGSLAIDPDGRFLIYATHGTDCAKNRVLFQVLDSSGAALGAPSTLVGCAMAPLSATGPIGLDIMKENQ